MSKSLWHNCWVIDKAKGPDDVPVPKLVTFDEVKPGEYTEVGLLYRDRTGLQTWYSVDSIFFSERDALESYEADLLAQKKKIEGLLSALEEIRG